jgi:hypothetical protein
MFRSDAPMPRSADPFGLAAMMLCESLLHALVDAGILPRELALEAVQNVLEVADDMADQGEVPARASAADILQEIATSFDAKE